MWILYNDDMCGEFYKYILSRYRAIIKLDKFCKSARDYRIEIMNNKPFSYRHYIIH